jgi:hypothetical protein
MNERTDRIWHEISQADLEIVLRTLSNNHVVPPTPPDELAGTGFPMDLALRLELKSGETRYFELDVRTRQVSPCIPPTGDQLVGLPIAFYNWKPCDEEKGLSRIFENEPR